MNFDHTEDRRMLSDMLKRFVAEQYGFTVRDHHAYSPEGYSSALWQRFAELGAIGALFHEDVGGLGGTGFDISVVFEAVGQGLVVEPFLGTLMAGSAIAHAGSADQRVHIEAMISGELIAAFAHAEPDSHYDAARVRTRASSDVDTWVLNGAKAVVEHGERTGLFIVTARSCGNEDDENGISLFMVPADAPGVQIRGYPLIDGGRAAEITFSDVRLGGEALLGAGEQGHATLEHAIGRGVLALCAEALGAMDAAREATLEYLRTRKQFGVPIGQFQALQHRMADALLEIEQARSAVINAASLLSNSDRYARERALSAAKYTIGRAGTMVAEDFIQLHGGIGMTWELPLAHYAKRLVMINHQLGDDDYHLARYIALGRA